jgi:hypothetical protein
MMQSADMNSRRKYPSWIVMPVLILSMTFCWSSWGEVVVPKAFSQALDEAASLLAKSQYDAADRGFGEVAKDPANSPCVRGLAVMGVAETALARSNTSAAIKAWLQVVSDNGLPRWQKDLARRRMLQTERRLKGLPEWNAAAYRAELPQLPKATKAFYVSLKGIDTNDGNETKPFATVTRARDAIRELKQSNGGSLPRGGVKVIIGGGSYVQKQPIRLTAADSGTAESPVVYEAQSGSEVVFEGGVQVKGWASIKDPAVIAKLNPSVRHRILETDLKANGIDDWGDATAMKKLPELFVEGAPQTLARWPNEGFVKTGEILGQDTFKVWGSISGCKDGKFRFVEDRAKSWVDEPDVRLYGYWFWDWFEEYQQVALIDPAESSFTLTKPYSAYGYRKGQRYFAVNVFRELDQPGEWYLDRVKGKLYWLPPANVAVSTANIVLSVYSEPFFALENVEHVVLLRLTLQDGRQDGIQIKGGSDCLVAGCTLRRLGGDAIIIDGGHHHGIFGCSMSVLGFGGMRVNGGDRQSLQPGNHFVENCKVSDISRIKRTYAPAVHLDGCGNRVAHNLFERIPSSAMRIEGNDHLIELNRIRNVVQESDDQGGIDMFGNPLYRGVVIRWNRWSDIIGGTECGAAGVRLDDMISGTLIQENIFERCGAVQFGGVQVHGGKDNVIDGNVFIACHAVASFSRWDESRWLKGIEPFLQQAGQEPYPTRYPELARIKSEADVNFLCRNLSFGCKSVFLRDGAVNSSTLLMVTDEAPPPELLATGNAKDSSLRKALFGPIPVTDMGPYSHPWRATGSVAN